MKIQSNTDNRTASDLAAITAQLDGYASVLNTKQAATVHQASLGILEDIGVLVRNEKAKKRLADHGCAVDGETGIVKFPREVIEKFRKMVPPTYSFLGRDSRFDITVPRAIPGVSTSSTAPDIVDPVTNAVRRATSEDVARIAHLVNFLDGIDVFSVPVLADDAADEHYSLARFYPALKNCLKPVFSIVRDVDEAKQIIKLCELIAGSREAFLERPFVTFGQCPIVSPLTLDSDSTELMMFHAENNIPSYGAIAPIGGLSAPLTLPGMLVLMNAEWLAMATLLQMSKPGTPMMYFFLPVFADMRDGAFASGAVETAIMAGAICRMGEFYGVAKGGTLGLTNAKINDAQAGFEKMMAPLMGTLCGVDYMKMGGITDAIMSFDYAQLMIDNEIAMMIKRAATGLSFSEDAMSLDEIAKVGPGGIFVGTPETFKRMRTATYLPELADRASREAWLADGATDIRTRALEKVREILTTPNEATLPVDVDDRIRAAFDGLVAGDSRGFDGWGEVTPKRQRRSTRRRPKNG